MTRVLLTGGAGYIGCHLAVYLRALGHDIGIVDPNAGNPLRYQDTLYGNRPAVDAIIHLAAHSSVSACEKDPYGAVFNNLADIIPWVRSLTTEKLIFASSGSVFDPNTSNLYDITRRAAEAILPILHPNTYVVRFGTVCGVSQAMRKDLLLNGMARDAVRTGVITVRNPGAWRPVLFFPDLCHAMERLIAGDARPGVYNLASFQARIGGWADMVANETGARIKEGEATPHYDFKMPILPRSLTTPQAVIGELMEYWRAHD